jgi:DNA polymerase II small subunit/DNA polymerase delta subunit B
MTVLERLTLELSNKEYFTIEEYNQFLTENDLTPSAAYDKSTMQKPLLFTVVDILEVVANDVDIMRRVETEFTTISEAYKYLTDRIQKIKDKIAGIPDAEEEYSPFSLMYTRR